ncbi:MAG: rhomboid family intramembrane serine protease [Pseudomonadales bacterium]|nr:rhomboid family intramembrane serine protease [Pseudomonadales bacterium]
MAELYEAMRFPQQSGRLDRSMRQFSQLLKATSLPHRVAEDKGELVLWVYHQEHIAVCDDLYRRFVAGEFDRLDEEIAAAALNKSHFQWRHLFATPITLLICMLSMLGFALVYLELWPLISMLSFQGLGLQDGNLIVNQKYQVWQLLKQGQVWRLFTPMFLHFNAMHIAFNLVLFVFFARQIEKKEGAFNLLSDILIIALISNLGQFWFSSGQLFGGLSGVVYGLMAYCWLLNILRKQLVYQVPQGLMLVSIAMMALSFFGLFSLFGMAIANWAHLLGLVAGLGLAMIRK